MMSSGEKDVVASQDGFLLVYVHVLPHEREWLIYKIKKYSTGFELFDKNQLARLNGVVSLWR